MATESLGYLLQGVSQQQPKVRLPGQVTEQINWHSDINQGATTRPPTEYLGTIPGFTSEDSKSVTVAIDDTLYRVVLEDQQAPKVFGYDGVAWPVNAAPGSHLYMSKNSAVYVYDNTVYITNRDKIVELEESPDVTSDVITQWGYVYVLGSAFSRTFTVTLRVNGVEVTGSFKTPDGTGSNDADLAKPDYIIEQLEASLNSALTTGGVTGVTIVRYQSYLYIRHSGNQLEAVDTKDGEANALMRGDLAEAKDVTELPKYAQHGSLIKVTGSSGDPEDDFWMRFNIEDEVLGSGMGKPGSWQEWFDVTEPAVFDLSTMPHKLVFNGVDFDFGPADWAPRRVGNELIAKTPSFVGASIRDIREFQGRLIFATSVATTVMSRVDFPENFFRKSAVTSVITDPIDLRSTQEGTTAFDWLVPFDKDMFVMSQSGQFVISGQNTITPANASLVLVTNYTMSRNARPAATGRTVLIPFMGQRFAGVNEYFTNDQYVTNSVDNLTKIADRYIEEEIFEIAVASNEGVAVFLTENSRETGYVWVYKYLWEGLQKTQSAWYKWKFDGRVKHVYYRHGILYFWYAVGDNAVFWGLQDADWGSEDTIWEYQDRAEIVVSMRLDMPDMYDFPYRLCMDGAITNAGTREGDNIVIQSPYYNPVFVLRSTDPDALQGVSIAPDSVLTAGPPGGEVFSYVFNTVDRPWLNDGVISYGQKIERMIRPTQPFARRYDGAPRSDVQLVINQYYIDYADSGEFVVNMVSPYRGSLEMARADWFPVDDEPMNPWSVAVRSGTLSAPWGEYSNLAQLEVYSDDVRPTTILEIRYEAEALRAGG